MRILAKTWFCWAQFLTIPFNILFTMLLKLKIERPNTFTIEHGTLIIANHQSKVDPFLISHHVGFQNLWKTLPIRYPVTPEYMNKPITGFIIRLLGGYSVGESSLERMQKLLYTRQLLKEGYTVVLFPEGKIVRDKDMVEQFQKGVHVLFSENYPMIFVRLTGLNDVHKYHFWKNSRALFEYSDFMGRNVSPEEKVRVMLNFYGLGQEK